MPLSRRALLAAPLLATPPLATPLPAAASAVPVAARPIDRLSTPWWRRRHEEKLAALRARPRIDLVLLGDSITQNLERTGPEPWRDYRGVWNRFYAPRHAFDLGFVGDATCHLLWRMQHGEIDGIAPKAATILIGANNMGRLHWPAADTVAGIDAIVAEARRRLPRTALILMAVLPCDRGPWVAETTAAINRALAAKYAHGPVIWHDANALFLRGGRLDKAMFYDPRLTPPEPALHPTPEGMARIAESLAPILDRVMR